MIAQVGYFVIWMAFLLALYGAGAAAYGGWRGRPAFVESARHAMLTPR